MRRLVSALLPGMAAKRVGRPPLHGDDAIAARAFDARFYLAAYPDVAENGGDPLEHYMAFGWREGRDPSAEFSTRAYLELFPDVATAGVNPFVHWLTTGRPKLRRPAPPYGFRYDVIARLESVDARVAALPAGHAVSGGPDDLDTAFAQSRGGLAGLHVTVSHDDYTASVGGLQAAIRREGDRLAERGRDHLHLLPARPWPVVRPAGEDAVLGVVWNGRTLGYFAAGDIARALARACDGPAEGRSFAIHSLLGHDPDEVADLLGAAGLTAGFFWLHDFASLCAGFHLLRDDVEDCAAPPADSPACGICVYGPWRARHEAAHARLFQRLTLTVVAPSQVTLDLWAARASLPPAAALVLPHATLVPREAAPVPPAGRPFRLAFAGLTVAHKGFPIFAELVARFAEDPRYDFVHLGVRRDPLVEVAFVPVDRDMAGALAAQDVDAVLVWPLCRETFSFVAYEAVAAGCAVITGPDSGNVRAFVEETGHGLSLADEPALAAAFESGAILELSRARRRPMLYDLRFSALSLDLPSP
ncbi:MAG: glycosyltransferase [Phenylobacterium sp.]|nr:glycosyltransferase [Phenylobacterium sp.]